jgi:hypothetical protein
MSQWTHVTGCIRFDFLPGFGNPKAELSEAFGRTCEFDDPPSVWKLCTVPCGSEGSVQYKIDRTGTGNSLAWGVVYVWGDLRHYQDAQEIYEWLKKSCANKAVRGCAVKIEIEYGKSYLVYDTPIGLAMMELPETMEAAEKE